MGRVGAVRALKAFSKWRSIDDPAVADELAELPYLARPDTTRTPVAELDDIQAVLDTCATSSLEDVRDRAIICLLRATGIMTRRGHRDLATAMCGGDHERSAPVGSALLLGHQPPVALLATWCDTRDFSHRNASASPNNRILPSARSVSATSMRSSEYDRPESAASCGRVHLRGADPR